MKDRNGKEGEKLQKGESIEYWTGTQEPVSPKKNQPPITQEPNSLV